MLDDWLKRRALANQSSGASRTFVVTDEDGRVRGYYAMAAGAVSHQLATGGVRRNMPDPVPVMVLARLAVDRRAQGLHLGAALLQDAIGGLGGARMTGGGFGGAVVALLPEAEVEKVHSAVLAGYRTPFGEPPLVMIEAPAGGASLI